VLTIPFAEPKKFMFSSLFTIQRMGYSPPKSPRRHEAEKIENTKDCFAGRLTWHSRAFWRGAKEFMINVIIFQTRSDPLSA
jgi:hypothetical protein